MDGCPWHDRWLHPMAEHCVDGFGYGEFLMVEIVVCWLVPGANRAGIVKGASDIL